MATRKPKPVPCPVPGCKGTAKPPAIVCFVCSVRAGATSSERILEAAIKARADLERGRKPRPIPYDLANATHTAVLMPIASKLRPKGMTRATHKFGSGIASNTTGGGNHAVN